MKARSIMQSLAASASLPAIESRAVGQRCIQRQPTRPYRLSHSITARHDSDIARRLVHGGLTGNAILNDEGAIGAVARPVQQAAYQPSGNGTKPQAIWLSLAARGG
jgi:hypothetical protein